MSISLDDITCFIIPKRQKQEKYNYLAIITFNSLYIQSKCFRRATLKHIADVKEINWNDACCLFFSVNLEVVLDFLILLNKYNICTVLVLMSHLCWCKVWVIEVDHRVVYQSSGNFKFVTEHTNKYLRSRDYNWSNRKHLYTVTYMLITSDIGIKGSMYGAISH